MAKHEITLQADLPDVTQNAYRIQVRCGETAVSVHEHGVQGSGSWAVWTHAGGHAIGHDGDKFHPTIERALAAATEYVRRQERSRLLHAQLRARLAASDA